MDSPSCPCCIRHGEILNGATPPAAGAPLSPLAPSCKLELIAAFPLAGVVESLAVLRARGGSAADGTAQRDAVLLTFRYEGDEIQRQE